MTPDPCQHLRLNRTIVGETAFYKCSDGWISVVDRLPDFRVPVIVHGGVAELRIDGWWTYMECPMRCIQWKVTHWQPLPSLPDSACHRNFTAEPLTIKVSYPEPRAEDRQ